MDKKSIMVAIFSIVGILLIQVSQVPNLPVLIDRFQRND